MTYVKVEKIIFTGKQNIDWGAFAKVKANISQIIPQLVNTATNRRWIKNKAIKHEGDANGEWYRYDVFFAISVKGEKEENERYNKYKGTLLVKKNNRGLFLYDVIDIKKEARNPGGLCE